MHHVLGDRIKLVPSLGIPAAGWCAQTPSHLVPKLPRPSDATIRGEGWWEGTRLPGTGAGTA